MTLINTQRRIAFASNRGGITLVELLAATVLAALLLGSIMGIVQSLERQRRVVERLRPDDAWLRRLEAQLRDDLANSRWMRSEPAQLTLVGFGGRDRRTGHPTLRPTEIRYFVDVRNDGTAELWRWERPLDDLTNHPATVEYCGQGVSRILVGRESDAEALEATVTADGLRDLHALPPRLVCILGSADGNRLRAFRVIQDSLR